MDHRILKGKIFNYFRELNHCKGAYLAWTLSKALIRLQGLDVKGKKKPLEDFAADEVSETTKKIMLEAISEVVSLEMLSKTRDEIYDDLIALKKEEGFLEISKDEVFEDLLQDVQKEFEPKYFDDLVSAYESLITSIPPNASTEILIMLLSIAADIADPKCFIDPEKRIIITGYLNDVCLTAGIKYKVKK
jgi:hypothetical protein